MATCQICKTNEAIWAAQYIEGDEPTFSFLGSHYRGFKMVKVCDECKEKPEEIKQTFDRKYNKQ